MNNELLRTFAQVQQNLKELELMRDSMRAEILAQMKVDNIEKIDMDFGNFTLCRKSSWTYSDKIDKLAEKLKLAKINEEEKGVAERSETLYVAFKPAK